MSIKSYLTFVFFLLSQFSAHSQIDFLQPRIDHFTEFSFVDFGGPTCLGTPFYKVFAEAAPRNQNAIISQIDYFLGGYFGSVKLNYNTNIGKYTSTIRQWTSAYPKIDSVIFNYDANSGLLDSCEYEFSPGGGTWYNAAKTKLNYDSSNRLYTLSESNAFAVDFYERIKTYYYNNNQLDSTQVHANDSTYLVNYRFFWSNNLLDSIIGGNNFTAQYYTYNSNGEMSEDSLFLGMSSYVSRYFYNNGILDSSMYDTYQFWDSTKVSCYSSIVYDSIGNYDMFNLVFYNHTTAVTTSGYYKFHYNLPSIGIGEDKLQNHKEKSMVYPNPSDNYINLTSSIEFIEWSIFDLSGALLTVGFSNINEVQIDISWLSKGVYLVRINDSFHKIIKN